MNWEKIALTTHTPPSSIYLVFAWWSFWHLGAAQAIQPSTRVIGFKIKIHTAAELPG